MGGQLATAEDVPMPSEMTKVPTLPGMTNRARQSAKPLRNKGTPRGKCTPNRKGHPEQPRRVVYVRAAATRRARSPVM